MESICYLSTFLNSTNAALIAKQGTNLSHFAEDAAFFFLFKILDCGRIL